MNKKTVFVCLTIFLILAIGFSIYIAIQQSGNVNQPKLFLTAVSNRNISTFKSLISNDLNVGRYFCSGYGESRGKNVLDIYSINDIPSDMQFPVDDEIPIDLAVFLSEGELGGNLKEIEYSGDIPFEISTLTGYVNEIIRILATDIKEISDAPTVIKGSNGFLYVNATIFELSGETIIISGGIAVFINQGNDCYLNTILEIRS